jgi:hypothetical protein
MAIAKALTPEALGGEGLDWLELDTYSPEALRQVPRTVIVLSLSYTSALQPPLSVILPVILPVILSLRVL